MAANTRTEGSILLEIQAADLDAAAGFYKRVFGWNFVRRDHPGAHRFLALESTRMDAIIFKRNGGTPQDGEPVNAFVCTIAVDNINEVIERAIDAGGRVAVQPLELSGVGRLAYIKDPDGNLVGLLQHIPS